MEQMTEKEIMDLSWVLAREDLWFLTRYILSTKDYFNKGKDGIIGYDWIFDRCRDTQFNSNRILDVWARFHWKSNIKTFALLIQEILKNPDITICIFSYNRPSAKKFLRQIQQEFETNALLRKLSWNSLLQGQIIPDSMRDLPRNSLDEGITVNRLGNPREPTLMATGLVDSLEVGPHYQILNYDDVVTKDSVTSPDMIRKTTESWELSLMLSMPGSEFRYTGTFYAYDDTYNAMVKRGIKPRIHPCYALDWENCITDPETEAFQKMAWHFDQPVLYEDEHLRNLWNDLVGEDGPKTANMQLLCDPSAGLRLGFDREDLRFYDEDPRTIGEEGNKYILVDPANEKKKDSDYTSIWVLSANPDGILYAVDIVRDRMNLHERVQKLFQLHRRWKPIEVRYEKYGMQADIEHIYYVQGKENYRFPIRKVPGPGQGIVAKDDRIERLIPLFKERKIYLPRQLMYKNTEGNMVDMVRTFLEVEFSTWPNSSYKDMLDSLSRITEPGMPVTYPLADDYYKEAYAEERRRMRYKPKVVQNLNWMSA
jgi:phage terminase large subunit-like protein